MQLAEHREELADRHAKAASRKQRYEKAWQPGRIAIDRRGGRWNRGAAGNETRDGRHAPMA